MLSNNIDSGRTLRSERNNVIRATFSYSRQLNELKKNIQQEIADRGQLSRQLEVINTRNETLRLSNKNFQHIHTYDCTRIDNLESKLESAQTNVSQLQIFREQLTEDNRGLKKRLLSFRKKDVKQQQCLLKRKDEIERLSNLALRYHQQLAIAKREIKEFETSNLALTLNHAKLQRRYAQATSVRSALILIRDTFYKSVRESLFLINHAPGLFYSMAKEWLVRKRHKQWNSLQSGLPLKSGLYIVSDGKRYARCFFDRQSNRFSCGHMKLRFWTENSLLLNR